MERYSSYKDSGISWIGEIPKHWDTRRLKSIVSCNDESLPENYEKEESILYVEIGDVDSISGIKKYTTYKFKDAPSRARRITRVGDVIISTVRTYLKAIAFIDCSNLIVSTGFAVLRPFKVVPKYMAYSTMCDGFTTEVLRYSIGISYPAISASDLLRLKIPLPPLAEQEKIVSYLEDKTSKIDAYVADKEKEIELLQELKQESIADAVTKGLNPDVKMKDYSSLISSLCPDHWKIVRNKSFLSLTGEKVGKKASEYVLLSLTTKGVIVRDIESGKGKFPKDFDTYQIVKPNELVFCLFDIDETPRTVGLVETEGMLTGAYTAFKVHTELANPEYIYNYYLCVDNIKALKPYYSGLRKTVRADKFQQIYMPLPPLDEQQAIVAYIEEKCEKIDKLASELQSEIDYLKEYKQRLIADCVTGQVNVQNEMI